MTIYFFAPAESDDYPEAGDRRDFRVRVIDHDEVTMTTKVEFTDGLRVLVRDRDLVSREV